MDLGLGGAIVVITGGSRGIGLATAGAFAAEGAEVVLVARDAARLAAAAEPFGERARTIAADLSTAEGIRAVAERVDRVDVLVNNAGAIPGGRLTDVDAQRWRAGWDLKVYGTIDLTRALYPKLAAAGAGVVVNVIGAAAQLHPPGYVAGASGNAALVAFTRTLAKTARLDGIRVVGVSPGLTRTERLAAMLESRGETTEGLPFGRPAEPAEIADAVVFLASKRSAYTTGAVLTIDGAPTEAP